MERKLIFVILFGILLGMAVVGSPLKPFFEARSYNKIYGTSYS